MSREDAGSNLLFFAVGAALGAAAGLLLAPRPGRETREKIADWLDERREKGHELLEKVKEGGSERKEQIVAAIKAGKEAFQGARHNHVEKEKVEA